MDQGSAKPHRLVLYSPLAASDFAENHNYTAHTWGLEQAERYSDFIEAAAFEAAANPHAGKRVEGHPVAYAVYVKWPKAKYGHYIIYRSTDDGIYVLRILHGAMNQPKHLSVDDT